MKSIQAGVRQVLFFAVPKLCGERNVQLNIYVTTVRDRDFRELRRLSHQDRQL